ncbi:MAG: response regulator [Nocardioidaceae bacterium]
MSESGELYRQIVDAFQDGIWIFDADARTTFSNDATAELLGRTPEEMVGLSMFDTLDDVGKGQLAAHLGELRAGVHNAYEVECCYLRKDGSPVWVMVRENILYDADGNVSGYFHRLTDWRERRELIAELRHSKEQLADAQEIAKTGSWEWNLVTDEVTWSDQLCRMMGVDPETFVPTREGFLDMVLEKDRATVVEAVRAAQEAGGDFSYDVRARRGDGDVIWIRGRGLVVHDVDGHPARVDGTAQDITDIKQVELQLLDAVVLNVLMQAMATAANESETLAEALGVTQQQLLGHEDWSRAIALRPGTGADGAELLTPMEVGKPDTEAVPFELEPMPHECDLARRAMHAGDVVFDERTQPLTPSIGFPIRVEDETAAVVVITARSPFERHEMLRSMARQVSDQLGRVAERERTADELAAARDAAMEASRLKSDFLATMSHEIRTPMNGVIGLNDLLLRTGLDGHQRRLAEGVQGAGRALLAVINDILDFSKIEAGKLQLESVDFEVQPVFEAVAAMLAETAHEKGIELVVGVRPEVPERLNGDPTRLSQVLVNLVSNAVKFTAAGEVVIRCGVVPGAGTGTGEGDVVLRVEVTDTGIGIPEAKQAGLFEPFSQADASTTRTHGGTGLGLAISRQLVAAIGGDIGVFSEPGVGSTFWFTGRFQASGTTAASRPSGQHVLHGRRALVVDDNESNRVVVAELLADWEMAVDEAPGADDALRKLRAARAAGAPYDVVLLDLLMPGRDGLQLAEAIRALTGSASPRLLLLSSTDDVDQERVRRAGISVNLTKPLARSALFDGLVDCLAESHGLSAVTRPAAQPHSAARGKHLLVVEDNEVNQVVALGVLEMLGYTADVAGDGRSGVERYAAGGYDAVLMDVQMPRMDGYAATRAIRAQETGRAHVPIIAMTAAAIEGEREKCLAAGMDDFLTKPLEPARLESTLRHWLGPGAAEEPVDEPDALVLDQGRLAMLEEMGEGAAALIDRAVANFITRAPEAMQDIRSAVDHRDPQELRMSSHRLKGSALNLGAASVGRLCLALEQLGDSGSTDGADRLLAELEQELDRAALALRDYQQAR